MDEAPEGEMRYQVKAERILRKTVTVNASSQHDAKEIAVAQADEEGWEDLLDNGHTEVSSVIKVKDLMIIESLDEKREGGFLRACGALRQDDEGEL